MALNLPFPERFLSGHLDFFINNKGRLERSGPYYLCMFLKLLLRGVFEDGDDEVPELGDAGHVHSFVRRMGRAESRAA